MATAAQKRQQQLEEQRRRELNQRNAASTIRAGNSPFSPFTPYQPPPTPSGYYDPGLDAQQRAAERGYLDTQQDLSLAASRSAEDYGIGRAAVQQGYDRGSFDLTRGYERGSFDLTRGRDRGQADIATQRGYEGEDYTRNVGLLTRNFQQLGRQQAEGARKYGVTSGGIALLSAAKRAENQGIEQQGLDIAHNRATAGFNTAGTRLNEDYTTSSGRLGEDYTTGTTRLGQDRDTQFGQLDLGYGRGVTDRATALERAGRENTLYGLDIAGQKAYQAQQAGYSAPAPGPRTRTQTVGGYVYTYDQTGRIISKKRAK
jgi:hypothetical protein